MEFRKMVTITLYVRQQKRHRCIQQSFGLCGRGQGWDGLGTGRLGLVHWDDPEGWYGEEGEGEGFRMGNMGTPVADSC